MVRLRASHKKETILERDFQRTIIELAESAHWYIYHVRNVRDRLVAHTSLGFPDLVLVKDRVLYRELKTDRGKLRRNQIAWLKKLEEAGQDAKVWRPKDWDEIEEELLR